MTIKTDPSEQLRQQVRRWLQANGLVSASTAAKAEALGIAPSMVSGFLNGKKSLNFRSAARVIERIGGSLDRAFPYPSGAAPASSSTALLENRLHEIERREEELTQQIADLARLLADHERGAAAVRERAEALANSARRSAGSRMARKRKKNASG